MFTGQDLSSDGEREMFSETEQNRDEQDVEMEVETARSNRIAQVTTTNETESLQEQNDRSNVEEQSSPIAAQNVHVFPSTVNSPDEFNLKVAKQSKKDPKSRLESPEKDDESQCCPICFEPWSNSGSHRLASLNCGHLFGKSCIERWLKAKGGNDKCPQCNAPAKKKDIRPIYAKAVKSIDTTERDRALLDLEKEKEARQKAEESEARALLQYRLAKAECERLMMQLRQQQELVLQTKAERSESCSRCKGAVKQPNSVGTLGESSSCNSALQKAYVLQTSFQITQTGARVLAFDTQCAVLAVSKPSPNQLFPGYGIVKVSSLDSKHCEFVRIHQSPIRDMAFSDRGDGLLLTASMDKTIKVTSINSNSVVQTYSTTSHAWSCTWNDSDTNYIYCGLQNGSCLIFDVRNTATHLKNIQDESSRLCPVVSVAHISPEPDSSLRPGGILVCKLEGACFWENTLAANFVPHHFTLPEGSCTSMSFESATRHCLFSLRPSKKFPNTRHLVCKLQGNGIGVSTARAEAESLSDEGSLCTCQAITQCTGGPTQKLLSKSKLFTHSDDQSVLTVAAGDETSASTLIWNGNDGCQLQKLPNQGKETLDVLPFKCLGFDFLATVSDQKLTMYKWLEV